MEGTACLSCLGTLGPLINLKNCIHREFINKIINDYMIDISDTYLCVFCHNILKKTIKFQLNIEENCKLVLNRYNLFQEKLNLNSLAITPLSNISIPDLADDVENSDEIQEILDTVIKSDNEDAEPLKLEEVLIVKNEEKQKKKLAKSKIKLATQSKRKRKTKANSDTILKITLTHEEVKAEREREMKSENFLKFLFKCQKCIVGYDHEQTLQQHLLRHDKNNGRMVCNICECVFDKEASYNVHVLRHYTRYECTKCNHRLVDKITMEKHYKDLHDSGSVIIYKCELCGHECTSKRSLRYHKEKHVSNRQCSYCNKIFSSKSSVKNHILKTHCEIRTFDCDTCNKSYKGKSGLLTHVLSHHRSDATVHCKTCNVNFKNIYNYQHHIRTHSKHAADVNKKFSCDQCDERFFLEYKLNDHKDWVHHKNYRHVCNVCDKKYISLRGLEKHKKAVHEKKRPPKNKICDYCGHAFITNSALIAHIRTHTGERPITCPHCTSTFKQTAALYRHKKHVHNVV